MVEKIKIGFDEKFDIDEHIGEDEIVVDMFKVLDIQTDNPILDRIDDEMGVRIVQVEREGRKLPSGFYLVGKEGDIRSFKLGLIGRDESLRERIIRLEREKEQVEDLLDRISKEVD